MATTKQVQAAKRNVRKARAGAQQKRSIAHMPVATRGARPPGAARVGEGIARRTTAGGGTRAGAAGAGGARGRGPPRPWARPAWRHVATARAIAPTSARARVPWVVVLLC